MTVERSQGNAAGHVRKVPEDATLNDDEGVLAVLVVRGPEARLQRVLRAVAAGGRRPSRLLVAVASAEADSVKAVVDAHAAGVPTTVRAVGGRPTFAAAVSAALSQDEGGEPWVWLLHDDAAPAPGCLEALVHTGQSSAKIGVVGPKQVDWDDPERLLEAGVRATRRARRVPEIGDDERDQGQYDLRSDVLGVGTAGMLVRRTAADAVGWLDPALGPFGDGLEFSRRMWLGEWRVVLEPGASVAHARIGLGEDERLSYGARRAAQAYNGVLASSRLSYLFVFLAYVVGGPVRGFLRLLVKEPRLAVGELKASGRLVRMFGAIHAGRRRIARARKAPESVLRSLEDRPGDVRRARRDLKRARIEAVELAEDPGPLVQAELRRWRASTRRCAAVALAAGAVVTLVAHLPVLGRVLTGGALLPDAWRASDLAGSASRMWLASGDGFAAPVDALWVLLAPFAAIARSDLGAVATASASAGAPRAALPVSVGPRALPNSPQNRAGGAGGWAAAPPLLGAVSQGHVAGVVWHVLAPLALVCVVVAWRRASVPALGAAAIVFAYMSAASPATSALALLVSAAGAVGCAGHRWRWLWLPVPAFAVLLPTFQAAFHAPAPWKILLSTPGQASLAAPSRLGLLSFSPTSTVDSSNLGAVELASLAVPGFLVLLAVACLLRRRNSGRIRAGFVLLGAGWLWAAVAAATTVGDAVAGASLLPARGWAGIGLSLAFLGLFTVLVSAGDGLRTDLSERSFGLKHVSLLSATAAACLAPLALAGLWSEASLSDRGNAYASRALTPAPESPIPAVARTDQTGPDRSRVLVLRPADDGIRATLLRGPGSQLHETSMAASLSSRSDDRAAAALASAVASLGGNSESFARNAAAHAVSVVLVPQGRGDATAAARTLMSQLGAAPGLEYVTSNASGTFWRVRPAKQATSRLRVEAGGASTPLASGVASAQADVPQSETARLLVLAERADPGWTATLNGRGLPRTGRGWQQAWRLPEDGGTVAVSFEGAWGAMTALGQAAILFAALVVALPLRRRKPVRK